MQQFLNELNAALPGMVRTDKNELSRRSHDVSYHKPHEPLAVVSVKSEQHIVDALKLCNRFGVAVIATAGCTSLEGHIIPTKDTLIVDTSDMDRIVELHKEDLDVVVEPGVNWMDLKEHLEPHGLFYPPDPGASGCIGGMCGTNCSGTLAWRYGTMKDHVLSLRVVLADGTVIKTRQRATKSSAGYDLTRLFVGSEGTLGIVSQATLRLRCIPKHSSVVMAQFPSLDDAGRVVAAVVHEGLPLHRMELMDDWTLKALNLSATTKLPECTTLLFECAGSSLQAVKDQIDHLRLITASHRCSMFTPAKNESQSQHLWHLRKRAYFAAKDLRSDIKCGVLTTDVAVPISHLVRLLHESRQDIDRAGLVAAIVAHAGDGNIHVLIVLDPDNPQEVAKAQSFRDSNARLALALGGTCTGEHGVGLGKMHLLEEEVGHDTVHLMRRIKSTLDPNGILNPNKIFKLKSRL